MPRATPLLTLLLAGALSGCAGDGAGSTDDTGAGSTATATTAATTGDASTAAGTGAATSTTTAAESTSSAATTSTTSTTSTTAASSTTGDATTTSTSTSTSGGLDESVVKLPQPCEAPPIGATRCEVHEVTCGGLPPAIVELAIYEATQGVPPRGTVVFGSGSAGAGFYAFSRAAMLRAAGFTLVDRRWPDGWFTGADDGPQEAACRLAALLRHLRAEPVAEGPLCATGNSGGSVELAYAITWQGAGDALDFALPSSGPLHRLDLACQGASDPAWVKECAALRLANCPNCASKTCELGPGPQALIDIAFGGAPRCSAPGPGDLPLLADRSPILGADVPNLGALPIHMLIGVLDPGPYAPLAIALRDALVDAGAAAEVAFVAGAAHDLDASAPGAAAIHDALLAECVPLP